MKIAVFGAGGIGAYVGARLARAGHPVALIARGAHADAMRAGGVHIQAPDGHWSVHPRLVTDDVRQVGSADVVILATKTYHLATILPQVTVLLGARTQLLTLQNGVEAFDQVATAYGTAATLAGTMYCELSVADPGVIRSGIEPVRMTFGPIAGLPVSPMAQAFATACTEAGIQTSLVRSGEQAVWSKAIFVAAMSAVTTLGGVGIGSLLADPPAVALLTAALQEAHAVARASGVHFDDDPVAQALAIARVMPDTTRSSMSRDLEHGRPLEVEALSGAIVRRGAALAVPTPVNQALYALLRLRTTQPAKESSA
jgi:2-dehydropantoate 2-reductase